MQLSLRAVLKYQIYVYAVSGKNAVVISVFVSAVRFVHQINILSIIIDYERIISYACGFVKSRAGGKCRFHPMCACTAPV